MRAWAVAIGIGHASHEECDTLGMTAALRTAGRRALGSLAAQGYEPDRVILDGNHDYLQLGDAVHHGHQGRRDVARRRGRVRASRR